MCTDFIPDSSIFEVCLKEADSDIGGEKSDIESVIQPGRKIWIDDIRPAPEGYIWIKTVNDFIDFCYENTLDGVELIDTDHDAGDYQSEGGDYIRCFDYLEHCNVKNVTIHIHSANPVGANNIRRIITKNKDNGWKEIRNTQENIEDHLLEDTTPEDITESIHFDFNDENINKADIKMIAYSIHVDENDDIKAYNPKNNPDKAIDIFLNYPQDDLKIEIFLDTKTREWDSWVNDKTKISPEQYGDFFSTSFYKQLYNKLKNTWANTDSVFAGLLEALENRKYRIDGYCSRKDDTDCEDIEKINEESGKNDFGTGKIDINKSREKNAAGRQIRSRSGRLYISPSDFSVKHDENEKYYCWPDQRGKGVYKWSNWADWRKIKPLCRMRFAMSNPDHVYGLTISPQKEINENRGFRAYDLTAQPPLQYLTPEETMMIMDLTIVRKFLKHVKTRIQRFLDEPDEDILSKISNPEKCTLDGIRQTKKAIRNALDAIRNHRADTYIYT